MAQVGPRVMWDGAWAMWGGVRSVAGAALAARPSGPSRPSGPIEAWHIGREAGRAVWFQNARPSGKPRCGGEGNHLRSDML